MKDKFFIDTNIFVYSFDASEKKKQKIAIDLIDKALETGLGVISSQVIQEFLNVSIKKFKIPFKIEDSLYYIDHVLVPLCQIYASVPLFKEALNIHNKTGYSFYDSMMLAAAIESGCSIFYTEDLQGNHKYNGISIINPFIKS